MTVLDPGLQPERTRLAWRRTLLGLTALTVGALRLLPPVLGVAGIVLPALLLASTAVLWWASRRRAARTSAALATSRALPGGALLGLLAGVCCALGVTGVVLALA